MNLQKSYREAEGTAGKQKGNTTNNNTVFVGSTTELQRFLKDRDENGDDSVVSEQ